REGSTRERPRWVPALTLSKKNLISGRGNWRQERKSWELARRIWPKKKRGWIEWRRVYWTRFFSGLGAESTSWTARPSRLFTDSSINRRLGTARKRLRSASSKLRNRCASINRRRTSHTWPGWTGLLHALNRLRSA